MLLILLFTPGVNKREVLEFDIMNAMHLVNASDYLLLVVASAMNICFMYLLVCINIMFAEVFLEPWWILE
jgi:hypothetical protein